MDDKATAEPDCLPFSSFPAHLSPGHGAETSEETQRPSPVTLCIDLSDDDEPSSSIEASSLYSLVFSCFLFTWL